MTTLDNSERDSNKLLRRAVNITAKKAMDMTAKATNKSYVYKFKLEGIKEAMSLKKATMGNLEAVIKVKGPENPITNFKVTGQGGKVLKAKVLRASKLTALQIGDIKAFMTSFKSGHEAVVQRVPDQKAKNRPPGKKSMITKHNQKLKALMSPSIPTMVGGEHGYGKVENEVSELLQRNVYNEMLKVLFK